MRWQIMLLAALPLAANAQTDAGSKLDQIAWQEAGAIGKLGSVATLTVPTGCRFSDGEGARLFAESQQNLPNPAAIGLLLCRVSTDTTSNPSLWFAEYSYSSDGYIKDAADEKLDADAILSTVREATVQGNEQRRSRGWATMEVTGWQRKPFYDPSTNNATWALIGRSSDGSDAVNHRVRLLGRRGVLSINMIADPSEYDVAVSDLDQVVATTGYVSGERYAEFQEGDKIAEYGLTALIAGGAGAAAAKLGLFGKLWKLVAGIVLASWKLLAAAVVGLFGWVASLLKARVKPQGGGSQNDEPPPIP